MADRRAQLIGQAVDQADQAGEGEHRVQVIVGGAGGGQPQVVPQGPGEDLGLLVDVADGGAQLRRDQSRASRPSTATVPLWGS